MTPEEKLAERGKRLYKNYRWTVAMVDDLFRLQNGKCGACGEPLGLTQNLDHLHFHVIVERTLPGAIIDYFGPEPPSVPPLSKWYATVREMPDILTFGRTKTEAAEKAKDIALPRSVRGLLHAGRMGCNRKLGRVDDPIWLRKAADYLENPPAKQILDKYRKT